LFVRAAEACPASYDRDVSHNRIAIDQKSIMTAATKSAKPKLAEMREVIVGRSQA